MRRFTTVLAMTATAGEEDPLEPLWKKAREAVARNDIPGVMFIWKSLADKGVWQICAGIGKFYEQGAPGVERNTEQALYWYRRAVFEGDDPVAHLGLGRAYYNGTGVQSDFAVALKHFQNAFRQGLLEAGIYLGLMHYRGVAVTQDLQRAEEFFSAAASADFPLAYTYLARVALTKWQPVKAVRLFFKAAVLGVRIAKADPGDQRLLGLKL